MNVIKPEIKFSDIQADPQLREMAFFYVIDDIIPELLPGIAYRRVGAEEQHRRKILKCPYCSTRLTDMDAGTKVELFAHAKRVIVKCQFYIRCFSSQFNASFCFFVLHFFICFCYVLSYHKQHL